MPKRPEYVVRVIRRPADAEDPSEIAARMAESDLLECLRYAGLVVLKEKHFDLLTPSGNKQQGEAWAKRNAERMQTYGYNAVVAPRSIE